jgi:hypothetical protein
VDPTGEVTLNDRSRCSKSDVVITRLNHRRLVAGRSVWVPRGDRWMVVKIHGGGAVTVRRAGTIGAPRSPCPPPMSPKRSTWASPGFVNAPASYKTECWAKSSPLVTASRSGLIPRRAGLLSESGGGSPQVWLADSLAAVSVQALPIRQLLLINQGQQSGQAYFLALAK